MSEFSKLTWRCRRGIKELDLALGFYMDTYYKKANKDDMTIFKQLLDLEDPTLYALLLGDIEPANDKQKRLLLKLRHLPSNCLKANIQ